MITSFKVKISIKRYYLHPCKHENKIYNRRTFWDWCTFLAVPDKRRFTNAFPAQTSEISAANSSLVSYISGTFSAIS